MAHRETLAITAAALQAVAKAYGLEPILLTMAGHKVAIGAILDEANRVLGEPLTDEELSIYLDRPFGTIATMQPVDRAQLGRVIAAELTTIHVEVEKEQDDGEA